MLSDHENDSEKNVRDICINFILRLAEYVARSFMKIVKSSGFSTLPCGTPVNVGIVTESKSFSQRTDWELRDR